MPEAKKTTRKSKVEEPAVDAQATDTPDVEMEPVKLTIQDLSALAQIIDIATQRGAFRAAEMSQVGTVFDRLGTFLKQIEATEETTEELEEAPAAE